MTIDQAVTHLRQIAANQGTSALDREAIQTVLRGLPKEDEVSDADCMAWATTHVVNFVKLLYPDFRDLESFVGQRAYPVRRHTRTVSHNDLVGKLVEYFGSVPSFLSALKQDNRYLFARVLKEEVVPAVQRLR